jgi:hypothetical protein
MFSFSLAEIGGTPLPFSPPPKLAVPSLSPLISHYAYAVDEAEIRGTDGRTDGRTRERERERAGAV